LLGLISALKFNTLNNFGQTEYLSWCIEFGRKRQAEMLDTQE